MANTNDPLSNLIAELEKLPGVGTRTAERFAYHLLKIDAPSALRLAEAIRELKERLHPCARCFHLADDELCSVCRNPSRDGGLICVVEQPKDVMAIEKLGVFKGHYHVLMGRVSPHEGVGPEKLTLPALKRRLGSTETPVRELIIATNPDAEGDATALAIKKALAGTSVRVTVLARGLPSGSTLDYANVEILRDAFEGRKEG